jgi:hypothetical protein
MQELILLAPVSKRNKTKEKGMMLESNERKEKKRYWEGTMKPSTNARKNEATPASIATCIAPSAQPFSDPSRTPQAWQRMGV